MFKEYSEQFKSIFRKGSFAQNVSIVMAGNGLNFLLQLAFTPILSRIFSPEAYGEYAIYNLILTNIGFYTSLSLPSVYLIPKARIWYIQLGQIVLFLGILGSVLVFTIIIIGDYFDLSPGLIFLMLLLVPFNSLTGVVSAWNARSKRFKNQTRSQVIANLVGKSASLSYGIFYNTTGSGFLFGDFLRSLTAILTQVNFIKLRVIIKKLLHTQITASKVVFKEYLDTIKFNFPSQAISKLTGDLPIILLASLYSTKNLGSYIFAVSVISIISKLIDNSIRPVLFQKAVASSHESFIALRSFFAKSILTTPLLSVFPLFVLSIISFWIFPLVFGNQWNLSASLVPILFLEFSFRMFLNPYVDFWRITKKEKRLFFMNIFSVSIRFIPFIIIFVARPGFIQSILYLTLFSSLSRLIIVFDLFTLIFDQRIAIKTLLGIFTIFLVLFIIVLFINNSFSHLNPIF